MIVIEHFWNNKLLYTVYAHLDEMIVKVGDLVKEEQLIGKTGDTGNTTGPHLHFQIETNTDGNHPFFPKGCKGSIDELVNEGNCFSEVKKNTLDPIYFLEVSSKFGNSLSELSGSIYIPKENIDIGGFVGGFMETNTIQELQVLKKDISNGKFLREAITIKGNEQLLLISPSSFQLLEDSRTSFLQSNSATGLVLISIQYGNQLLTRFPIIIDTLEAIEIWKQNKKLIAAFEAFGIVGN